MKSFLEEDKEVRYFPNDSEMPILIHYLQVYFSHPERSIQRSQVVQSVVSILSSKNKHWNHRTVRLWFNNNKRVFFRPSSPITQSSNSKDGFQARSEPPNVPNQVKTPLYIPARPLSVVQLSSSIPRSGIPPPPVISKAPSIPPTQQQQMQQLQQMQKMNTINIKPNIPMNNGMTPINPQQQQQQYQMRINQAYQRSPYLIQQPPQQNPIPPPPPPSPQQNLFMLAKPGSFALMLNSEVEVITTAMLNNPQNIQQVLSSVENDITEKIADLHEQRWMQLVAVQPARTSIIDNNSLDISDNNIGNGINSNGLSNSPENPNLAIENNSHQPTIQDVSEFDMIDCAIVTANTGEVAVISWDFETQCQRLHFRDGVCSLCGESTSNICSNAKAIAYSENSETFWVNSGNYLKPISAADLTEGPSIKTNLKYSERSAMTFWNEKLVLASGSSIMTWSPKNLDEVLRDGESDADNEADNENSNDGNTHNPNTEDSENFENSENFDKLGNKDVYVGSESVGSKKRSLSCIGLGLTLMIPSITSLTTVGENLVIASTEHHAAQVYATNGALVAKCIGHTSGISCLHSFDANSFITGSSDQTAKYWDVRVHVPVFNLLRHRGIVTEVYGCGNVNPNLIITGGTDGIVRGWDIRQLRNLFSFSVGQGSPMAIGMNTDGTVMSVVTSEKVYDSFYDFGKYGSKLPPTVKYFDAPPNAILSYTMP